MRLMPCMGLFNRMSWFDPRPHDINFLKAILLHPMTLEQIFADVFVVPSASVHDDLQLREIASWDSMSHMMLIMRLEESFNVQLTGDQIADIKSVGDARSALRTQGAEV